ncbi:hypothetical protein B0H34DRAFT_795818 [Crassisporium funariophilum]|nr:hypothetical protein B0H34DRAFT_795818 [Crassisporium funariophilum]
MQSEIKAAMKRRDSVTSTTLRSVLSEINAADKVTDGGLAPSAVVSYTFVYLSVEDLFNDMHYKTEIVRKAAQRRTEAAAKFSEANRPDLAEKERLEVELLSRLLPPLLSSAEIDSYLQEIIVALPAGSDPRKSLGLVFKDFYSQVEKSSVNPTLVKQRAQALLESIRLS